MTVASRIRRDRRRIRLLLAGGVLAGLAALPAATTPVSAATDIAGTRQEVGSAGVDYVIKTDAVGAPEGTPEAVIYEEEHCHVSVGGSCIPPPVAAPTPANSCPDGDCQLTCQQKPSAQRCDYYDPHEMNCDNNPSNAAYKSDTWDGPDQIVLKIWLRWSNDCQSNWSKAEADNAFSSDQVSVAMGYDAGPPPGSGQQPNYDSNTVGGSSSSTDSCSNGRCTDEGYGDMLYGGSGTACTTAYAWLDQTNPVSWWYTKCV